MRRLRSLHLTCRWAAAYRRSAEAFEAAGVRLMVLVSRSDMVVDRLPWGVCTDCAAAVVAFDDAVLVDGATFGSTVVITCSAYFAIAMADETYVVTPGTRRIQLVYGAIAVLLTLMRAVVSQESPTAVVITYCYPVLTIAAIGVGIRLHRPARRLPWFFLMSTFVVASAGTVALAVYLVQGRLPFPSIADCFWLACYPLQLTGLMLLIDGVSWKHDRSGIVDTLMVTGGLGLGVWLLFLRDLVGQDMPPMTQLVTVAYPLADLLLLAGVIRMLTSSARRNPCFWQLTASLGLQSVAHAAWVWRSAHHLDPTPLSPVFVFSALLLGGAALHPSMVTVGGQRAPTIGHVTALRVVLIGSSCLLSPTLLIINGVVSRGRVDWLAAAICCIVVFLLVIVRMIGLIRTVQDQADQLESIAYLDGLTGVPNRRAWDTELQRRLAAADRIGGTLVVGLIDLDHFKRYNDLLGHPAGDALLRIASTAWQSQLRAGDLIARYGGEEFGLILHCRLRDASIIMDRLREVTPDAQTFSAGLAQWTGTESAAQLTARADEALYAAKREGRDQFAVVGNPAYTNLLSSPGTSPSPEDGANKPKLSPDQAH